ncbi:arsenate reductase ArsC [Candidatus Saganbacteria bacterium]|nr:arsenate reductase ArsC [Candidatus Saganbacteria bacterium]
MSNKIKILFVCVENTGRSQMAEGFAKKYAGDKIEVFSAGSKPLGKLNPVAIQVMQDIGIDIAKQVSKGFDSLPYKKFDYVVTMGCGDACPFIPSTEHLDWKIEDPKGKPISEVAKIRDEIGLKVKELIDRILEK